MRLIMLAAMAQVPVYFWLCSGAALFCDGRFRGRFLRHGRGGRGLEGLPERH